MKMASCQDGRMDPHLRSGKRKKEEAVAFRSTPKGRGEQLLARLVVLLEKGKKEGTSFPLNSCKRP